MKLYPKKYVEQLSHEKIRTMRANNYLKRDHYDKLNDELLDELIRRDK